MKIRDNLAAKCRLENETISKLWINANKEKTLGDTIKALRIPESPADQLTYTRKTSKMADLAKNYHDNLQTAGLSNNVTGEDFDEVLDFLKPKLPAHDKNTLATYLT